MKVVLVSLLAFGLATLINLIPGCGNPELEEIKEEIIQLEKDQYCDDEKKECAV